MNEIIINEFELPELKIKDYEVIKEAVEKDTAKYQNYIVTKDSLEADTKKRAELRNQAKAIDNKRKDIEKEISTPIKEFKSKCDALKKMYEESANLLDVQIKKYEEETKQKKKAEIQILFDELVGKEAISSLLTLDMIFDERYLNKTYSLEDIEKDLFNKIRKIANDLKAIKNFNSEHELALINIYLQEFDLGKAINENSRLESLKKETKVVEEKQEKIRKEKVDELLVKEVAQEEIDPIKTYILEITAPLSKQKALRKFLELNKMQFKKVEMGQKHE